MARVDAAGVEGDQHLLLLAIDHHHEAAVAARAAMDRLAEAHLPGGVPLPRFLVAPAVFRQRICGTKRIARGEGSIWKSVVSEVD